jgi:hypothetical protein
LAKLITKKCCKNARCNVCFLLQWISLSKLACAN